jgi:hypothetical protein
MADPTDRPATVTRASSTERWRRWRARQDTGESIIGVPVDHELIEAMLDAGVVDERGSRCRQTLARAIRRLCSEAITNALAATRKR